MVDFSGLRVKLLQYGAKMPARGTDGAAGYDLFAPEAYHIPAGELAMVKLGFATEMPHGIYGQVQDRSSLAFKHDLETCAGTIDNDYRGEWGVLIRNHNLEDDFFGEAGDRIAQVVFRHFLVLSVNIVDELQDTLRGEGGFGSTGK